jgi:hypothetical protein
LNEASVGPVQFRVAAKFKQKVATGLDPDGDDDWDGDLAGLKAVKDGDQKRDRLTRFLERLDRYTLSGPIQVTIDPFKLPPDPGEEGDQTLQGIDTNHDGVRDDIERYIAITYVNLPRERLALMQLAKALQVHITSGEASASVAQALEVLKSLDCLSYVSGRDEANRQSDELLAEVLNTKARSLRFQEINQALSGSFLPVSKSHELKTNCSVDVDR